MRAQRTKKNMKHLLLGAAILLLAPSLQSAIRIRQSNVTEVTVYRTYAREVRMGQAQIPQGQSEVIIGPVTQGLDEASISVGCKNGVRILSVSSRINYIPDSLGLMPGSEALWQDSIKILERRCTWLGRQKEAYESELNLLNQNSKLGSEKDGLKPEQLRQLLDLHRERQTAVRKMIFDHELQIQEGQQRITLLKQQLAENGRRTLGKPVREIVLKVYSPSELQTNFRISYLVTNASWTPTYEIRCENTGKPLAIQCRAKVTQQTGFDWKNVRVKLSTANPNMNHNRPVLYPLYVDFMQPDYYQRQIQVSAVQTKNMMLDKVAEKPASVQMMAGVATTEANEDMHNGMKLEAGQVTIAEGDLMTEYEIDLAQDIESDGQEHMVPIQEISIPAIYNHHTVPRLDNGVFLVARLTDWGRYNLLAGEATLFFDDMYIGKSYLNPNISADTMLVSLGRDEKIQVKRNRINERCTTKKLSNRKKETRAYEILVKNNKTTTAEVEVLDQFPISRQSDIAVELEESSGAIIEKDYGKLLWRLKLQAGESRKLTLVYTIRYPDDKVIAEKN